MWLIFERKDMEKNGQMPERSGMEREHSEVERSSIGRRQLAEPR